MKIFLLKLGIVSLLVLPSISSEDRIEQPVSEPEAIIWDLGGVLTEISWYHYAYCIGPQAVLWYIASEWWLPLQVKKRVFALLAKVKVADHLSKFELCCIPGNLPMPLIMGAYQAGLLSREEILPLLNETFIQADSEGFFTSSAEKWLLERMADEMFNPEAIVYSYYVISEGVELIRSLAGQLLQDGTRRYKLYVLSNWEPMSFREVRLRSNDLFSLFDGIVISGEIGKMKPYHDMFEHVVETYKLDKSKCIFIDDQEENVKAARKFGIGKALLFKNYTQLRQELKTCGVKLQS